MVGYMGAERCVEELLREFPDSELLTTMLRRNELPDSLRAARPSFLQWLPGAVDHHEWLLPAMPSAWLLRKKVSDADVVISSSHACAKAVRYRRGTPHVCYCHTPMRYAWGFESEAQRVPAAARFPVTQSMKIFRSWDRKTSERVTQFVANSTTVAERIRHAYGRGSRVVYPPVRTDFFTPGESPSADRFLFVGRLVSYKRADLAIEAFRELPYQLAVVGRGPLETSLRRSAPPNVTFLGGVEDVVLRDLYRRSRALIFPGEEDFGIVMAEAQACGTPVVAYGRGGARDIVHDGLTGWLVDRQDVATLRGAIHEAATHELDPSAISRRAQRFAARRFRAEMHEVVEDAVDKGFA